MYFFKTEIDGTITCEVDETVYTIFDFHIRVNCEVCAIWLTIMYAPRSRTGLLCSV